MIELTETQRKKILKSQQSQMRLLETYVSELFKSKSIRMKFNLFVNRVSKIFDYLRNNILHSTPKSLFALSIYYAINNKIQRDYYQISTIIGISHVAFENMQKTLKKRGFNEEKMKARLDYD